MKALRSIVYVSTATSMLTEQQLEALLIDARDFNLQNGITGVLLYDYGCFMQCFERPEPAMAECYARIRASRKHRDITERLNRPTGARHFPDWQMGFAQPAKSELLMLSTARWAVLEQETQKAASTPPGLLLLKEFWQGARRR